MQRKCKFCWGLWVVSIAVIGAMAYMFIVRGSVVASDDGRTAIIMSAGERDMVLADMRIFLESVEAITGALAENDMNSVADHAKQVGVPAESKAPVSLMAKLPLAFKTMGMATHQAFDDLAQVAADTGDGQVVLTNLSELMNNCTTCHAGYRIQIDGNSGE